MPDLFYNEIPYPDNYNEQYNTDSDHSHTIDLIRFCFISHLKHTSGVA
jgi:hypothetical protein